MTPRRFGDICEKSKLRLEKMETTPKGVIYLAEGYAHWNNECPEPHIKTLWATARDGMDIAQPLYFRFDSTLPTKSERLKAAKQAALEFLNA